MMLMSNKEVHYAILFNFELVSLTHVQVFSLEVCFIVRAVLRGSFLGSNPSRIYI
jgi:hypothetical protein